MTIIPTSRKMTLKSIAGERLLLVHDPEQDDEQAAEQRDQRPVTALEGDQRVGDEEDGAGDRRRPSSCRRGYRAGWTPAQPDRNRARPNRIRPAPVGGADRSRPRPHPPGIRARRRSGCRSGRRIERCASDDDCSSAAWRPRRSWRPCPGPPPRRTGRRSTPATRRGCSSRPRWSWSCCRASRCSTAASSAARTCCRRSCTASSAWPWSASCGSWSASRWRSARTSAASG